MRKRIRITSPCVADRYASANERIIEFSGSKLGGLISLREDEDGTIRIEVYRADPGVTVRAGGRDIPAHDGAPADGEALSRRATSIHKRDG